VAGADTARTDRGYTLSCVRTAVIATGAIIRLASHDERQAVANAHRGRDFELQPSRSYRFSLEDAPRAGGVLVVSQTFVDFDDGTGTQRWDSYEVHGQSSRRSKTPRVRFCASPAKRQPTGSPTSSPILAFTASASRAGT
jgi:hypothetical protein